jgi:hypothetical protein
MEAKNVIGRLHCRGAIGDVAGPWAHRWARRGWVDDPCLQSSALRR